MTDPQVFYNREDLWVPPQEKFDGKVGPMDPYYILMKLPGSDQLEYLLMSPFTPQNRDNMISWLAARSDFPDYGKMLFYELPKDKLTYGPNQISAMIDQNTTISEQLTLWDQKGSGVIRGKLVVIPIENSFLYVVPLYLQAEGTNFPQLKRVIAATGDKVVMQPTLDEALSALFGSSQETPLAGAPQVNGVSQPNTADRSGAASTRGCAEGDRFAQTPAECRPRREALMKIAARAGQLAIASDLVDVPKLLTAYYEDRPDPHILAQRVVFGTSGHRGSSFDRAFNEWHILAITQAICLYRQRQKIDGPLFLGIDTHALSRPALASALEVLAANNVDVMLAEKDDYTPTPVISHAILGYNRDRRTGLSDGIVITPSHNPPECGGFKYNPPHGGPAEEQITSWIEACANGFLTHALDGVKRVPFEKALSSATTHRYDYLTAYVKDLENIVDMEAIRNSGIRLGVDPLGGAGVHYWEPIAERYGLNLKVVNNVVDPTFRFMTLDWDGRIRMDPSSPYAMRSLLGVERPIRSLHGL